MTSIIELDDGVFEYTAPPDTPGNCPRRVTIRQLSGKPLPREKWHAIMQECMDVLRRGGAKIHSVKLMEEEE